HRHYLLVCLPPNVAYQPRRALRAVGGMRLLAGFRPATALCGAGAPRSRPSVLKSSSISGQWMPKPPPAIRQFERCAGLAERRRGYQTSGTEMVRPSSRSTTSSSSVKRTSLTRSPGLTSEVLIPRLQQLRLLLDQQSLNAS